ncbi:hypothetical protein EV646_10548 [Kribbella antiqua]|uniref:Uncharacterized protein n=1 Tax=Kribbella antiqua TaxID=2512217 RepID=A0A4R2IT99_9ACTN|nr:hypothetical protein [Kribbella antiqua]TCO47499.1 hypothetical protein EV646_10548 [Kribbella antiqua]
MAVALALGLSATAACSGGIAGPVAPSPGLGSVPSVTKSAAPTTGSAPTPAESIPEPSETSPGPGETKPGIKMNVVPRRDGSFDVTEDVMLPKATDIIQLQLPTSGEHLPGMMTPTKPMATELQILADGQSVPLAQSVVDAPQDLPLTQAATKLRLTYRLVGSTLRRTAAKPRRAVSALRPLTAITDGMLPTNLTVTGGLLNAVCPLLTETRCAVGDPPVLGVLQGIPADKALVVVQLDLP